MVDYYQIAVYVLSARVNLVYVQLTFIFTRYVVLLRTSWNLFIFTAFLRS